MFQSKGLMSQVAMVQSRNDQQKGFKKKINLPAAIFNRSPLREPDTTKPLGKPITPSRKSITANGISPLKSRRQESVILNQNLNLSNSSLPLTRKSHSNRETAVPTCQSHSNKQAKYYVHSDDETLMYCEKCAILLASQGFKVVKMEEMGGMAHNTNMEMDSHPRTIEISKFLNDLEKLVEHMMRQRAGASNQINRVEGEHQEQVERVNNFYQFLFDALQNHKETVLEAVEQGKVDAQESIKKSFETLDECISDCNLMKQDVLGSSEVIKSAQQRAFRPVMQSYKQKLSIFRTTSNEFSKFSSSSSLKQVIFNDVQQIGKRLLESIQVRLQQPETNQDLQLIESQQRQSSVYFSFDNQSLASNRKSQEENPVMQSSQEERVIRGSMMKKKSRQCFQEEEMRMGEEEEGQEGEEEEEEGNGRYE